MKLTVTALVLSIAFCSTASAGTVLDFFSPDAPVAIPDNTGTFDVWQDITIPGGTGTILDLDVDLIAEHTWQGDLNVEIEHLDTGTRVSLLHGAGDSDDVSGAGFSADNFGDLGSGTSFILDDEAAAPYDSATGWGAVADPGIDNVTGKWQPYGMFPGGGLAGLSAFDGEDSAGTWRLYVSDNAAGDLGTLHQFSMHVEVPEPATLASLALMGLMAIRKRR